MGQNESTFKRTYEETVAQLSSLQLQEIILKFNELYKQAGGSKGHVVDREAFARYFNLPTTVGDRLFEAFDEKKNGKVSFEEFVCGLAIVLHGSFHDRCALVFHVFNLAGDEGVSRAELTTMLTAILQSTDTILYTVCESGGAVLGGEERGEAVSMMVTEAFKHCDITRTGKLLPVEFEYWLKRNPKVLDSLLSFSTQDDQCTLGQLIMSPSEQKMGVAESPRQQEMGGGEPQWQQEVGVVSPDSHGTDSGVTFRAETEKETTENFDTTDAAIIADHIHSDDITTDDGPPTESSTFEPLNPPPPSSQPPPITTAEPAPTGPPLEPYLGEDDRLASIWIPGEGTEELLTQHSLPPDHLTCPALGADIAMTDPIGELLAVHFPEAERRPLLTVDSVTMDVQGLRKLVAGGCFQGALDLTARFLSAHGQGAGQSGQPTLHTHKTLQMWSSRLSLLLYIGLYKEAEFELEEFGELDNPDLYYQHHTHTYPGRKGSLVPFSMRVTHAILPSLTGKAQLSLDRLCSLKHTSEKILEEVKRGRLPGVTTPLSSQDQEVATELWTCRVVRVIYSLGNALISLADYHTATLVYKDLLPLCPDHTHYILSGLGRLYLTLGDLQTGREYFNQVEDMTNQDTALVHINRAFVNVSLSRWQAVRDCLQTALSFEPTSLVIKSNLTVATFYLGHLKESIERIETLLKSSPPSSLQSSLFANLAAAYELESGKSMTKKLNFVPLLGSHVCEGFQLQALNIR